MYKSASGLIAILVLIAGALTACARAPMTASSEPIHSWVQVWSDEFDGDAIDPNKWEHSLDCTDHGNNEAQCYTDRVQNSFVDGKGILHIVAREEEFSGPAHSPDQREYDANDTSVTKSYTSARLRSKNLFDFKYGRVEVRARLAGGQGMWPAIWMLPTDWVYGGWPSSGEIDIMEAVNLDTPGALNQIYGSMNYGMKWPQWSAIGKNYVSDRRLTRKFHTFMIEWEADEIRWFVDGIHYQTQTSAGWYNYIWGNQQKGFSVANPRAPYDQDFHMLLNLAVGGHWPGQPDRNWKGDREFLVDYVRVYQCDSGNADGSGCASAPDAPVDASIEPTPDSGAPRVNRFPVFQNGPGTINFKAGGKTVTNTLIIGSQAETAGDIAIDTTDIGDNHGQVLDITFSGPGNVFLASGDMGNIEGIENGFNLAGGYAWSNHGTLEFDLLVESIDAGTTLMASLDSGDSNRGQHAIEIPAVGQWHKVAIRISDLLASPLAGGKGIDLNRISKLVAIEATGSANARIRLDNISLTCAVNEYSKPWQPDTACSIEPLLVAE